MKRWHITYYALIALPEGLSYTSYKLKYAAPVDHLFVNKAWIWCPFWQKTTQQTKQTNKQKQNQTKNNNNS